MSCRPANIGNCLFNNYCHKSIDSCESILLFKMFHFFFLINLNFRVVFLFLMLEFLNFATTSHSQYSYIQYYKISFGQNKRYKKCTLIFSQAPFNLRFLYVLKHKIHLSKTVCGIFHFQFRLVFI